MANEKCSEPQNSRLHPKIPDAKSFQRALQPLPAKPKGEKDTLDGNAVLHEAIV